MMLHAGFILPFLLLATADNNVRKQRTPGEVDGGYFTEDMYPQYRKADDWIPEPNFILKAIPFFGIPDTKDAVLVVRCVFFLVLVGVAFGVSTYYAATVQDSKDSSSNGVSRTFLILCSAATGVALVLVSIYILAVVVYFNRR
ncbi:hypothetical protein BgAZ_405010 [Babesia gibsoni]|uniref:Transmembrane protein n=1 Tax=Babesia gibsoni TaxID=33632 RepID=A0AAD8PDQ3_BABGI|nr:hypothetical protein BgAZ_405010 [Babesia gibsoni]